MPSSSSWAPEVRRSTVDHRAHGRAADHQRRAGGQRGGQGAAASEGEQRGDWRHSGSCGGFLFSEQLGVDAVADAVQREDVDFLDAGGALVRHADVHVGLAQQLADLAAAAAR